MKRKIFICVCGLIVALSSFAIAMMFSINSNFALQTLSSPQNSENQNNFLSNGNGQTVEGVELGVYYSETSYGNLEKVLSQTNKFTFVYTKDARFELRVESELQPTDSIKFYYCKNQDFKYVEIPNINNFPEMEVTNILTSVGTYQFFAVLNDNLSGENINLYEIEITKSTETEFNPTITYEEIIGNPGEINKYKFILQNLNETGYDIDDLTILWYIVEDNTEYLIATGNSALYTPLTQGRFTVRANVLLNSIPILDQSSKPEMEILARSNNSANVLMYVLIVVGVLSVGLAISIVIKIKSEKVW